MQHGLSPWTASRGWRLLSAAASAAAMVIARADAWAQPAPTPAASARQTIDCGAAVGERNICEADTSVGRRAGPPVGRG